MSINRYPANVNRYAFVPLRINHRLQRVRTTTTRNSTLERVKYFDIDDEEDSTSAGVKKYHYIHGGNVLCAIFVKQGAANDTMFYVFPDHLGSLTTIVNASTSAVKRYSYNAWGIPRDATDWTVGYTGELFAGRGFTGHEHLTEFSLINMNGRIYDPILGRFLSPDPYVQSPAYPNNYNRYAYALNNPLIYTDPDGEFIQYLIGAIIGGFSGYKIGKANGAEGWGLFWYTLGGAAIGTIAGHIGASIYASSMAASYATGVGGFVAGANAGALSGLASGMVSGGGMGALSGGGISGISKGMTLGGLGGFVGGGLFGGIGNGIQSSKSNGNFWDGSGQTFDIEATGSFIDNGAFKFKNNDELIQWAKENGIDLDDFRVEQLSAYDNANYLSGNGKQWYTRGEDGYMYRTNLKSLGTVKLYGTTRMTDATIGNFCRTSNIYMSRISDVRLFAASLNHELIHAYHISQGLQIFGTAYTERIAHQYSISVGYSEPSILNNYVGPPYNPILPPYLIPLN